MTDLGRVVVEEEVGLPLRAEPSRAPWVLAVVGFALGLGLGVLVVGPPPTQPTPTTVAEDLDEDAQPEDHGVSAEVDGFPDALVAIGRTAGSSLDHLLWPHGGALTVRPMSGGEAPRLDASGLYIALTNHVPGQPGAILSVGRFNQISTVATDVTSYAWHDGQSGVLAYTTEIGGTWRMFLVKGNFRSELVTEAPAPGGRLVAWGDWGYALQTGPQEVTLLTPDGVFKDVEAGVALDSHPDGWLFLMADRPKLVTSGGGVLAIDVPLEGGRLGGAVFSPDAQGIALMAERGIQVVEPRTGVTAFFEAPATTSAVWSSDSRFVVSSSSRGAFFHDTHTASTYRALDSHVLLDIGVIELQGS